MIDISIIVPVYNVEELLPRCIESIMAQTKKEIEIILVDDGATDGSGAVCDAYAKKDETHKSLTLPSYQSVFELQKIILLKNHLSLRSPLPLAESP